MKASMIALLFGILFLAASCNSDRSGGKHASVQPAASEASGNVDFDANQKTVNGNVSSEAAMSLNAPERKIIKTADLRCQVTDVFAATTRMERLAATTGGQISESKMENVTENLRTLPYKTDSLRDVVSYTTTAHLILRIPVMSLDTVLSDMAANAAFINSRSLHLDDVTMRYLSNKLKNEAMESNDPASRARTLAHHSGEAVLSGDYADQRNETRIDRHIENMQLRDQVTYATLTVDLYQPQRISQTIVPDIEYLMKPTMGQQAGIALNNGWQLLRAILIGLMQIWPLLLIATIGYLSYRFYKRRRVLVRA